MPQQPLNEWIDDDPDWQDDQPEQRSLWQRLSEPLTDFPSRVARHLSGSEGNNPFSIRNMRATTDNPYIAGLIGAFEGATEGLGDVASGFTSPINLGTMFLGGGSRAAAGQGLSTLAKAMKWGERASGAASAVHGAGAMASPESTMFERGLGLAETAGGLAGVIDPMPAIRPKKPGIIPPEPIFQPDEQFFDFEQPMGPTTPPPSGGGPLWGNAKTLKIRDASPEIVKEVKNAGYNFIDVDDQGRFLFERSIDRGIPPETPTPSLRPPVNPALVDQTLGKGIEEMPPGFWDHMKPEEMRVPGVMEGGELENIAMGGASPRVLDVLGTSLYTKDRPSVVSKELFQNALDELVIAGKPGTIRALFETDTKNPMDTPSNAITIRDEGRGMTPEQLYTIFTNIGETGKMSEESASGGFGFAKAAPMLSGNFVRTISVVDEPGGRFRYVFEGNPVEMKNQEVGVPLTKEPVGPEVPTGLTVTTWFPKDADLYYAKSTIENMAKFSPKLGENKFEMYETHGSNRKGQAFLNTGFAETPDAKFHPWEISETTKADMPPLQSSVKTPGADIDLYFNRQPDELGGYNLHYLNKGLYQNRTYEGYGLSPIPNVPRDIFADIKATVAEGEIGYPFGANREQVSNEITKALSDWVAKNIAHGAQKEKIGTLQKSYEAIKPMYAGKTKVTFLDDGNRFTPEEVNTIATSLPFRRANELVTKVTRDLALVADKLNWTPEYQGSKIKAETGVGWMPSLRLRKVGLLFKGPDKNGSTTLGIHIPSPAKIDESAILYNIAEILNSAVKSQNPVNRLATSLYATITHELSHIPGGGHDKNFAYRHAELLEELGRMDSISILNQLAGAYGDVRTGQLNPEILDILHVYNESRRRPARVSDDILTTGIASERPPDTTGPEGTNGPSIGSGSTKASSLDSARIGQIVRVRSANATPENVRQLQRKGFQFVGHDSEGNFRFKKTNQPKNTILESDVTGQRPTRAAEREQLGPAANKRQENPFLEAYNVPRGLMAGFDLSAPLRQGLPLIHKGHYWTEALPAMFKAWASEDAFQSSQRAIYERPLFKRRVTSDGKIRPSFAEDAGLKLTDLVNNREEALVSTWVEKVPGIRRSNRAYTAFLNQLRADTFEQLVKNGQVFGADAKVDVVLARALAEFVNTASGRGSIGKLEPAAKILNQTLFSPRLIASRVKMLNPVYYIMAPKQVRNEALKSLFAVAAAGNIVTGLGKLAGGEVSNDPSNSDFGKLKLGNTRIDPYAGFQQYIVAANRLLNPLGPVTGFEGGTPFTRGQMLTSSIDKQEYDLWNPMPPANLTHADIAERFVRGKAHPVLGFIWSIARGQTELSGEKMNFAAHGMPLFGEPKNTMFDNAIMQRFIPIILQDMHELAQSQEIPVPLKLILGAGSTFGLTSQTYGE